MIFLFDGLIDLKSLFVLLQRFVSKTRLFQINRANQISDMSGWLLMGLPGAAYAGGFSSIWIMIGLIFGTMFNWIFVANRLRVATEVYNVFSITEYFEKRVNNKTDSVALISGLAITQ